MLYSSVFFRGLLHLTFVFFWKVSHFRITFFSLRLAYLLVARQVSDEEVSSLRDTRQMSEGRERTLAMHPSTPRAAPPYAVTPHAASKPMALPPANLASGSNCKRYELNACFVALL